jgi:hypothetical protein
MRGGILRNRSLTARPRQPGPERAEPRLFSPNPPRPFPRPATANPAVLAATRDDRPNPSGPGAIPATDRRPVSAVGNPNHLVYISLAGLVLFALAAFLWFSAPAGQTVATSLGTVSTPPPPVRLPEPIPPEAAPPPSAAATSPGEADVPRPAAGAAAPSSPPAISSKPASANLASLPASQAGAARVAAPPSSAKNLAPDHPAASPPAGNHRAARIRAALPHPHLRAARDHRPPAPQPRSAQSPPQRESDQAASFDRLVNQLTEPTKPGDPGPTLLAPGSQSLTPPAPGAEDPFARHASDK